MDEGGDPRQSSIGLVDSEINRESISIVSWLEGDGWEHEVNYQWIRSLMSTKKAMINEVDKSRGGTVVEPKVNEVIVVDNRVRRWSINVMEDIGVVDIVWFKK